MLRRLLGVGYVALLALPALQNARAGDRVYDVGPGTRIIDKLVVAPGSLVFFGINPLRFPNWTVTIDDKLVAGPQAQNVSPAVGGQPIVPPDLDWTPAPMGTPTAPPEISDVYNPDAYVSTLPEVCDFSIETPKQGRVTSCVESLRKSIYGFISSVRNQKTALAVQTEHKAHIIAGADNAIRDAGVINNRSDFDHYIKNIDTTLFKSGLIENFNRDSDRISDWPALTYLDISTRITSLLTYAQKKLDTDNGNLGINPEPMSELATKKHYLDSLNAAIARSPSAAYASGIKPLRDEIKARVDELITIADKAKIVTQVKADMALVTQLKTWETEIKPYDPAGPDAISYGHSLALLRFFTANYSRQASPSRFGYAGSEDCKGLAGGGRERVYTIALSPDGVGVARVRVICRPRMFLSGGLAFSGLAQPVFGLVPAPVPLPVTTGSPGASPAPAQTPAGEFIQATTATKVRATAMILNNIRLSNAAQDDGWYGSVGLGVQLNNSTGALSGDYLAGISYSFSNTLVITAGTQFGQMTELAPGYHEGQLVSSSTQIQTITRVKPSFFLGFSFGKTP